MGARCTAVCSISLSYFGDFFLFAEGLESCISTVRPLIRIHRASLRFARALKQECSTWFTARPVTDRKVLVAL